MERRSYRRRRLDLFLISTTVLLTRHFVGALSTDSFFVSGQRRLANCISYRRGVTSGPDNVLFRETRLFHAAVGSSRSNLTDANSLMRANPEPRSSSPLQVRKRIKSAFRRIRNRTSKLYHACGNNGDDEVETWSRSGENGAGVGVRKRVKAVLNKAKSRTGISNSSDDSPGHWIAQTASIGGLSDQSDLVYRKKNGSKSNGALNTLSSDKNVPSVNDFEIKNFSSIDNKSEDELSLPSEVDGIRANVLTPPLEPLPLKLPVLTTEQKQVLLAGERVQEQSKMGREGSGYVVMDVKAPPFIIWEALLDFEAYPQLIKTVRAMEMYSSDRLASGYHSEKPLPAGTKRELRHYGIPSVTRAAFVLSKFRLNIAAIHNYRPHPDGHYMIFNLDPDCTNMVLQSATGIWYTQCNPDGRGEVRCMNLNSL